MDHGRGIDIGDDGTVKQGPRSRKSFWSRGFAGAETRLVLRLGLGRIGASRPPLRGSGSGSECLEVTTDQALYMAVDF